MLECVPHWQILGGLIICVCGGFLVGRQMACHKSYGNGKRETEIKYLKKIAAMGAELKG